MSGNHRSGGHNRKSDAEHAAAGTWRADRHAPPVATHPAPDDLPVSFYAPEHLSPPAAAFWLHCAPWLVERHGEWGCMPAIELLTRACEVMETMDAAREVLQRDGLSYETSKGGMQRPRPEVKIQREAAAELSKLLHDLRLI